MSAMDEGALVSAASKGDVRAFNQLVLRYQNIAFNVAYRILGDEDAAAAASAPSSIAPIFRRSTHK